MAYGGLRHKTPNSRNRLFELFPRRRNSSPHNKKALRHARRRASRLVKSGRQDMVRTFSSLFAGRNSRFLAVVMETFTVKFGAASCRGFPSCCRYLIFPVIAGYQLSTLAAALIVGLLRPPQWLQVRGYTLGISLMLLPTFREPLFRWIDTSH